VYELRDISKCFGSLQALHPLSLRLPPGRTTVLLGPSGCGKSTLVRLLLEGAVPAAALALLASGLFEAVERAVVPRGLRLRAEPERSR
jgi:osmoprotectant transport system ATP-binding protein